MAKSFSHPRILPQRGGLRLSDQQRKAATIWYNWFAGGGAPSPSLTLFQKHITNKWVDVVFDSEVYNSAGEGLSTSDFSINLTSNGGASGVSISAVKRADSWSSASASDLTGGEIKVRLFLSITGTINGLESLTILATVYNSSGQSRQVSFSPKLNVNPLNCWDFRERSTVTVTGNGVSQIGDLMSVFSLLQTTDADRPQYIENVKSVFDKSNTEYLNGGDQSSMDFQETNSFTVVLRFFVDSVDGTKYLIANKSTDNNNGWQISVGADGSLFFSMHDGTTQKFTDTDNYAGSPEATLIFVNNAGTLTVYNDEGDVIGGPVSTDIGTINYSGVSFSLGHRGASIGAFHLNGYIVTTTIFNSALDATNRAAVVESLTPQLKQTLNSPPTSLTAWNTAFAGYKIGAFVSYGMTTYTASDKYSVNKDITPPVVATFDAPSNIFELAAGWIDDLEGTGKVDFYCLTSGHHIGFKIYPSAVELRQQAITDASLGSINIPVRSPYCASQDVLGAMVTRVKSYNKPVYIYFNIGRRVNERGSNIYGDDDFYFEFVRDSLKELIDLYSPDGFFLDAMQERPWFDNRPGSYLHRLYSAIKDKNPNCKIILNQATNKGGNNAGSMLDGGNLGRFAQDAACFERDIGRTLTDTDEYDVTIPKNHYGTDYFVNVCDIVVTNTGSIYFGSEDKGATPRTQQAVQDLYDASKAAGVPLFINFSPSQDGSLESEQVDFLDNLTL